jgi:aminoglycoside 3-N-acetyltransferase
MVDTGAMSEQRAVETSADPVTIDSLERDLRALGLRGDDVVLVHASLSSLGWVCGGAVAVVTALLAVLGPGGTLVVPTHSGDLSDPAQWVRPPVPRTWWDTIRRTMPPFDPATTPSRGMGAVAELVRTWPGARRSEHPQLSFAALGPAAAALTAGHSLTEGLGERSPLARLYDRDAKVLLLGVGHERNTSLHLAEYRSGVRSGAPQSGPVLVDGQRRWLTWDEIDLDADDFPAVGAELESTGTVRLGLVGSATARLMRQRVAVDFAGTWLGAHVERPGVENAPPRSTWG